jgi:hypothetical protein
MTHQDAHVTPFDLPLEAVDQEILSVKKVLDALLGKKQRLIEAKETYLMYVHKDVHPMGGSVQVNGPGTLAVGVLYTSEDRSRDAQSLEQKIMEVFRFSKMDSSASFGLNTAQVIDSLVAIYGDEVAKLDSIKSTLSRMANRDAPALKRVGRMYYLAGDEPPEMTSSSSEEEEDEAPTVDDFFTDRRGAS